MTIQRSFVQPVSLPELSFHVSVFERPRILTLVCYHLWFPVSLPCLHGSLRTWNGAVSTLCVHFIRARTATLDPRPAAHPWLAVFGSSPALPWLSLSGFLPLSLALLYVRFVSRVPISAYVRDDKSVPPPWPLIPYIRFIHPIPSLSHRFPRPLHTVTPAPPFLPSPLLSPAHGLIFMSPQLPRRVPRGVQASRRRRVGPLPIHLPAPRDRRPPPQCQLLPALRQRRRPCLL